MFNLEKQNKTRQTEDIVGRAHTLTMSNNKVLPNFYLNYLCDKITLIRK